MTIRFRKSRSLGWVSIAVMVSMIPIHPLVYGGSWLDDFKSDPFEMWTLDTGPGEGFGDNNLEQFDYEDESDEFVVEYDSSLPTVRMERELNRPFTHLDAFAFSTTLRFDSIEAEPNEFMQICFALTNSETTGANRTGAPPTYASNTFDNVELAYYPNLSQYFGGPYVTVTVQGSDQGSANAFDHLSFESVEYPLPLYTTLEFTGHYNPMTGTLNFRIGDLVSLSANIYEPPDFGMAADGFAVDRFALTTYFDGADCTPETTSLLATVSYDSTQFLALGDGDDDGDVDLPDFGDFQRCFSGGGVAAGVGCETHDFDGDADVDLDDYAVFQYVASGPAAGHDDHGTGS